MKMPPLQYECKRPPLHLAAHASVGDADRDVRARVPRVKVRRVMLAVVDRSRVSWSLAGKLGSYLEINFRTGVILR